MAYKPDQWLTDNTLLYSSEKLPGCLFRCRANCEDKTMAALINSYKVVFLTRSRLTFTFLAMNGRVYPKQQGPNRGTLTNGGV